MIVFTVRLCKELIFVQELDSFRLPYHVQCHEHLFRDENHEVVNCNVLCCNHPIVALSELVNLYSVNFTTVLQDLLL